MADEYLVDQKRVGDTLEGKIKPHFIFHVVDETDTRFQNDPAHPGSSFAATIEDVLKDNNGWVTFEIDYSQLNVAANTEQIDLINLPAGYEVVRSSQRHTTSFSGPGITDVKCRVGYGGQTDRISDDFDVYQAQTGELYSYENSPQLPKTISQTVISATFTADAFLNNLTSGYHIIKLHIQKVY